VSRYILPLISLLLIFGCNSRKSDVVSTPVGINSIETGKALVNGLAACGFCHGVTNSPLETGIGARSVQSIVKSLRQSVSKDERLLSPVVHRGYEWLSDQDAVAIASYLKSLPPVRNSIEQRDVSFWERNTVGIFTGTKAVPGSVPSVTRLDTYAYGKYLVSHVARCAECHSSEASITGDVNFLAGGKEFSKNGETGVAPSLIPGAAVDWSAGEIIQFLDKGMTPSGKKVNPDLCPVGFFKGASKDEKSAIALFLKKKGEE